MTQGQPVDRPPAPVISETLCHLCLTQQPTGQHHKRTAYFIPDIAPLTGFHALLVTTQHWTAFADLEAESYLVEIRTLMDHLRLSGQCAIVFEHGSPTPFVAGVSGKCNSTEHAHIHIVGTQTDISAGIWEALETHLGAPLPQESPWAAPRPTPTGYVWFADPSRSAQYAPGHAIPRQLMRRVVLDCLPLGAGDGRFPYWADQIVFSEALSAQSRRSTKRELERALLKGGSTRVGP